MNRDIWHTLPWLANGTLEARERERVESAVAGDPELGDCLKFEQLIRDAVKAEQAQLAPPPGALDAVMKRINQASRARPRNRFREFLASLLTPGQWSPQFAVAMAVVVVQFGVIGSLLYESRHEDDYSAVRSVMGTEPALEFIRVMFRPDITEAELRETLQRVGAEIVAGPSQIGDYYLYVEPDMVSPQLNALKADPNIVSAEVVDELPDKP